MSTRFAGSLCLLALTACSGEGGGADACRAIERARCERQAECEDWSDETLDDCRRDRDAVCRAGAAPAVRDASEAEVDACVTALGSAECEALDDPFTIPGCEPLAPDSADAGS